MLHFSKSFAFKDQQNNNKWPQSLEPTQSYKLRSIESSLIAKIEV